MVEYEVKCPSGAVYKLKRLNYLDKKNVYKVATKFETEKNIDTGKDEVKTTVDPYVMLEESLWRMIVSAPWLPEGKKCSKEMLENIEGDDGDVLDKKVEDLNFPSKD